MKKPTIVVNNLSRYFTIYKKETGLFGSFKSLVKRDYTTLKAVNNVSFEIKQGEIVGFIGQNGAGKTTTLKMLSGLLHPTAGSITVLGYTPWERKNKFKKQFSLVLGQKNQLWFDLPAIETFELNKSIYDIPDKQYKTTLSTLVELLEIQDILEVQVRKLSLGQRMKCELVASLLHNPKVLFLDEPTIGLDVIMQQTLRDFIKKYNKTFNATIILTSHYMGDVTELCERAIMIDQGEIMYDGNLQTITRSFAPNKIISLVFSQKVSKKKLRAYGEIVSYDYPKAKLAIERDNTATQASKILKDLPIEDVTIEEPPIEAIIREIFKSKNNKLKR